MKTISDLVKMKKQPCFPFSSAYSYFISRLADYYISRSNGIACINHELEEWDESAKACIIDFVIAEISHTGIYFDENELRFGLMQEGKAHET